MQTKFIEATQDGQQGFNWGKFMIARFTEDEWTRRSALPGATAERLLPGRGWTPRHVLFVDLQTGEGTILKPGGYAHADLQKHKIWICPMAEPFIEWLYTQDLTDLDRLPSLVELPDAEAAFAGHRRPGPTVSEIGQMSEFCLDKPDQADTCPVSRMSLNGDGKVVTNMGRIGRANRSNLLRSAQKLRRMWDNPPVTSGSIQRQGQTVVGTMRGLSPQAITDTLREANLDEELQPIE